MPSKADAVLAGWHKLAAEGLNNRAVAARLGISEAQLVDCARGSFAVRLRCNPLDIFSAARALGIFKMVLRNDYAVLERPGAVRTVSALANELRVEGSTFSLQMNASAARSAFALREGGRQGVKNSVQLFDSAGNSIAKLVVQAGGGRFDQLVEALRLSVPEPLPEPVPGVPASLRPQRGDLVAENALAAFLHNAAGLAAPLRIVVSHAHGMLQAETRIHRVKRSDRAPWINVLDPELDLHLFEARIRRLAMEGTSTFHWLADDGAVAFSVTAPRAEALTGG